MSTGDFAAVWVQLKDAGLVEGKQPATSDVTTPWYVRAMLGFAGWIGALCLLGFVATGFAWVLESAVAALFMGGLLCTLAAALFWRLSGSGFVEQFAFTVSLAGQALIVVGLNTGLPSQVKTIALLIALVEAVLFAGIAHFLHRVWAAMCGLGAVIVIFHDWGLTAYMPALFAAVLVEVWSNEFTYPQHGRLVRAFGYSVTLMSILLMFTLGSHSLGGVLGAVQLTLSLNESSLGIWIGAGLIGLVLIWLVTSLLRQEGISATSGPGSAILAGAGLLALVTLKAQGIGLATIILLVGYAQGNRSLAGLGIFSLLTYLAYYYYSLQSSLLEKSLWLIVSGGVLLAMCFGLRYMTHMTQDKEGQYA